VRKACAARKKKRKLEFAKEIIWKNYTDKAGPPGGLSELGGRANISEKKIKFSLDRNVGKSEKIGC